MGEQSKIVPPVDTTVPPAVIIPVEAYISEDYAKAERDKLWRKVWLQAGRVEDLPEVGSYITYDILDDSVLIVRTAPDSIKAYHGDRSRLYVTGLSMGGYGAWQFAVDHPGLFAAAAVVCGAIRAPDDMPELVVHGPPQEGNPYRWVAERIKPMPVWIFHGDADDQVAPSEARNMYAALLKAGDEVRYTQFAGVGHGSWVPAYATPQLWPWMFSHRLPR